MDEIKNAIYAIISLPKIDMENLENNEEREGLLGGINGTCFFISDDTFITAHHCLNQTYANNQIYFLINRSGHIISGVHIIFEDSKTDLCVGKIDSTITTCIKAPNQTNINGDDSFTAYGFSNYETQNFRIKIKKENDQIKITENDALILKEVNYNFVDHILLKDHKSNDSPPIHLIDCNVVLFDKAVELGFSGGPTLNNKTNEVLGFTSQNLFYNDMANPVNIIIPVINCD